MSVYTSHVEKISESRQQMLWTKGNQLVKLVIFVVVVVFRESVQSCVKNENHT